ncbi:MAG TPA: phosphoribosylaminoimidazolesuccinocarboxamide synthase [Candidatus Hydrogenedentes bacterium]|nr:phosphoribosylaminoimidazolesuccinocarboxamide synthase [Candidatus Hydrogenedentota bacterium]
MNHTVVCNTTLPNRKPDVSGKVRDIYDLGDKLLLVATDRISAFDWVNPVGIPDKGRILTQISLWWFEQMADLCPNHLISADVADFPDEFHAHADVFGGRSMLVHKCEMLPVEMVVRGYLAGSGLKEYKQSGTVCGIKLPEGLVEASKLEEPIYTPATKATDGHDLNISPEEAGNIIGGALNRRAAEISIAIYKRGREIAAERGIILCDTKFEFGMLDGRLTLADEILTPDSSRFWPADQYKPGQPQPSYDKQFVRDYLEEVGWDKNSPPPPLPDDVVEKTREKYMEAYRQLTGRKEL